MSFNNNEEAVSPVIGVILMVAITVILAAVIAVFVFGMADSMETTHSVAVTAKMTDANTMMFTLQGGADASTIQDISVQFFDKDGTLHVEAVPGLGVPAEDGVGFGPFDDTTRYAYVWNVKNIGESAKLTGFSKEEFKHGNMLVWVSFNDGTRQQVLNKPT
jgi:flagellin-like protein